MVTASRDPIARFRNPEYTGENRCRPCTLLNLAIATLVAGGVFLRSRPLGVASFVGFAAVIYLRGYLVPGTPELSQRYLPPWLRRWVGKRSGGGQAPHPGGAVEVSEQLARAGVTEGDDSSRVSAAFSEAWRERIRRLKATDATLEAVARLIEVDPERIKFRAYPDGFAVSVAGAGAGRWPSRTAFVADLAAAMELRSRGVGLDNDISALAATVGGLRGLLSTCPACNGALETDERTAVACCGSAVTPVRTCLECEARLYEFELEDGDAEPA